MLPHKHFIIALMITLPISILLIQPISIIEIIIWVLIAGIVTIFIDIDVMIRLFLTKNKQLKPFRNPKKLFGEFKEFMNILDETGILKTVLITHAILSISIILIFYIFFQNYFIPALIGVITHILSDIPNIMRVS